MKKRIIFVDDEPNIVQGLQRMLRNMRDEWDMEFAGGGEEVLKILSQRHCDVIVTDMRMPGIDGAELLNRVMDLYPKTVRIILSGHSDREMVMRAVKSTHQFLAKPCDPQILKNTIIRACQIHDTLTNESLKKLVVGLKSLPCMTSLYDKISQELQNPNASLKRVGDLVAQDVTMTAEVLKLVNSAFFGLPHRVNSPQQAVSLLGIDILKGLILYVHFFTSCKVDPRLAFSIEELCQHSILVSNLAVAIARSEVHEKKVVEDVLIAGILHDIGKLILSQSPEEYLKIKKYSKEKKCSFLEAEYQTLGTSHAEIGAYLLGLWGNPGDIIEAVLYHHDPKLYGEEKFSTLIAVYIADYFANHGADTEMIKNISDQEPVRRELLERFPIWQDCYTKLKEKTNQDE